MIPLSSFLAILKKTHLLLWNKTLAVLYRSQRKRLFITGKVTNLLRSEDLLFRQYCLRLLLNKNNMYWLTPHKSRSTFLCPSRSQTYNCSHFFLNIKPVQYVSLFDNLKKVFQLVELKLLFRAQKLTVYCVTSTQVGHKSENVALNSDEEVGVIWFSWRYKICLWSLRTLDQKEWIWVSILESAKVLLSVRW